MIELSGLNLLLLIELIAGLVVSTGLLLFFQFRRKSKAIQAAKALEERIRDHAAERAKRLRNKLTEQYQYDAEAAEAAEKLITQSEMRLYEHVINSYIKQDLSAFAKLDADVDLIDQGYQGLEVEAVTAEPEPIDVTESPEYQRLQEENTRLTDELRVTMDTMARMLNEYSTMFAGGAGEDADNVKAKLHETYRNDSEQEGDEEPADKPAEAIPAETPDDLVLDDISETIEPVAEPAESESVSETAEEPEMGLAAVDEELAQLDQTLGDIDIDEALLSDKEDLKDAESMPSEPAESADKHTDEELAAAGSLEDEWAKLLEEDANSQSEEGEAETDPTKK